MFLLLFLMYNSEKPGSFPGKEDMEKSLQKLQKDLEEARREKDKARQELKRLKQHLLEKVIYPKANFLLTHKSFAIILQSLSIVL